MKRNAFGDQVVTFASHEESPSWRVRVANGCFKLLVQLILDDFKSQTQLSMATIVTRKIRYSCKTSSTPKERVWQSLFRAFLDLS